MRPPLVLVFLAACSSTPEQAKPTSAKKEPTPATAPTVLIVDITKLVGRSREDVKTQLGEPTSCEEIKPARVGPSPTCLYNGDTIEVVFINGKADWITVNGLSKLEFSDAALGSFGLSATKPSFDSPNVLRWTSLPGLHEVSLFPGQGRKSDYLYVKAVTD